LRIVDDSEITMSRNAPPPPSSGFMDEIRKIPPVTRTLLGGTLAITVPIMLELLSPYKILFAWHLVKGGEVWRIPSSFFFGGMGFPFIFDMMMLYRNSDNLESSWYPRRSADYAYQLLLASIGLLGLNIPLHTSVHFRPLLCCITYLSSRLNPDAPVSIFGLLTIKALYFPFALVGMDLISGGPGAAMISLTGVIIGHLWYILEWQERGAGRPGRGEGAVVGRAPQWLKRMIGQGTEDPGGQPVDRRPYGTAFVPRGASSLAAEATRHAWGGGHRLGSE